MASASSSRPLRTTRQSSRESAGGGIGTRGDSQRGDDDAASISSSGGGRLRNNNPYGRVYGSVTAPPATLQLGGAASRGGKLSSGSVASDGGTEGGGGGGGGGKKVNIPGFLTKTYDIFSSGEYSDLCGWGPHGDTIIITKVPEFSSTVLPRYFKHSNFQSFVRQLNMYDFHKTVQDPSHGEFRHQYFKRGRPDLLPLIKRKVSQPTGAGAGAGGGSAAANITTGVTRSPHHPPQDLKPVLPSPPASPAHTAAATMMMAMPGSALATSMDVDGSAGGGAGAGGGGVGSSKPSKSWQKRTETRLQECEDLVKRLSVENHMLWTHVHTTQAMAKALKRTQLRMVGIVQDVLLPSTSTSTVEGGGGAGAGSSGSSTGAGAAAQMALQKLKSELETLSMSPAAAALDGAGLEGGLGAGGVAGACGGGGGDILSALPPSMAMAAGAGAVGEDGVQLARTMSLSDPLVFWRNVSLGSIPSFGPGAVHSLLDPSTAGAAAAAAAPPAPVHNNGAAAAPAPTTAAGAGAVANSSSLMSPPAAPGAPPEGFGLQMSFQRLGSGSAGGPSRKRSRLTHEAAQGIADQLTVLHRESQTLVGRVDSMEQHLSSILGLDPDAWPESMEEAPTPTWTAPAASAAAGSSRGVGTGGGRGEAAAASAGGGGTEGGGGGKDEAAGAGAGTGAGVPPPSALEGAPLVKQQAVSMSGAMAPPPLPPLPPGEGGTAGID